jgi:hypothetical protein
MRFKPVWLADCGALPKLTNAQSLTVCLRKYSQIKRILGALFQG